jgi:pimeloyl-ACP methyl ester carboxylesterase
MTIYMNFRQQTVGGGVKNPTFLEGDGTQPVLQLKALADNLLAARVAKRDVLFAVHGFNVSFAAGACALGRLEQALGLPSTCQYIAVLWPGDYWLPVVNYPFEGAVAIDCGGRLASFCNQQFGGAASLSFVTHSLGARVALAATKNLGRKARSVCLTAGAINYDCLAAEYARAFDNSSVVSILASRRDLVLKLAFPIGDPIADLFDFDHKFFEQALGYTGPIAPIGATAPPWQIPDDSNYNHGDYLPPSDPTAAFPDANGKWVETAGFMKRAFAGVSQTWP